MENMTEQKLYMYKWLLFTFDYFSIFLTIISHNNKCSCRYVFKTILFLGLEVRWPQWWYRLIRPGRGEYLNHMLPHNESLNDSQIHPVRGRKIRGVRSLYQFSQLTKENSMGKKPVPLITTKQFTGCRHTYFLLSPTKTRFIV